MLAGNNTLFAALAFEQAHRDGDRMGVIAVRATFQFDKSGKLSLSPEQKLVLADEYEGDPYETTLLRVGDLIPFKPRADITLLGEMCPEGDKASALWSSGIKVGSHPYLVRSNGLRYWEPQPPKPDGARQWRLGESETIDFVPMDYRYAAGGDVIGHPMRQTARFNPRGRGLLHPQYTPADLRHPAPLIDSSNDPVIDPFVEVEPQGTAPIPPFWHFRAQFAGTRDEAWKKNRCPRLPADFDYRFHQSAHPKLIYPSYLRGDELVQIVNMYRGGGRLVFRLPALQPVAEFEWSDGRKVMARLNLDGLHIDMREGPPWRLDLTWRGWVVVCPRFFRIKLTHVRLDHPELAHMPRCAEEGLVEASETKENRT